MTNEQADRILMWTMLLASALVVLVLGYHAVDVWAGVLHAAP